MVSFLVLFFLINFCWDILSRTVALGIELYVKLNFDINTAVEVVISWFYCHAIPNVFDDGLRISYGSLRCRSSSRKSESLNMVPQIYFIFFVS
jgi:hypothetical protein